MARFDIRSRQDHRYRDVSIIQNAIQKVLCPKRDVQCDDVVEVESIGDGIILTGTVATRRTRSGPINSIAFRISGSDFASSSAGNSDRWWQRRRQHQ